MRRFAIIAAISVIALVGVLKIVHFGTASRTEAAVAPLDSAPSSDWNISGRIQEMNGNFWVIQGFSIRVNDDTRVSGIIPTVGAFAAAEGIVQPDATWLATRIRVSDQEITSTPVNSPTATPTEHGTVPNTATPTATATATGTIPNTPTPTMTPTPTATEPTRTATPTRVATATEVSESEDENDDDDRDDTGDKDDKSAKPPHPTPVNHGKHLGHGHSHSNHGDNDKGSSDENDD